MEKNPREQIEVFNLSDNGEDCVAWRWTWNIRFPDGTVKSYATNAAGNGLFDCDNDYDQLRGKGQFSLAGKSVYQARAYIRQIWHQP